MIKIKEGMLGAVSGGIGGFFGASLGIWTSDYMGLQGGVSRILIVGLCAGLIALLTGTILKMVFGKTK